MDDARGTIRSKCHTLYVFDLRHSNTLKHSYIFFLRLFASDREGQLRIHKDQFSSLSSFFHEIAKNDQPIPKIDCALTNLLAGVLSSKEKQCTVAWMAHITPLEKNFEETINSLTYLDKIKQSLVFEVKQKSTEGAFEEHRETIRAMLERAQGEYEDLSRMYMEFNQ